MATKWRQVKHVELAAFGLNIIGQRNLLRGVKLLYRFDFFHRRDAFETGAVKGRTRILSSLRFMRKPFVNSERSNNNILMVKVKQFSRFAPQKFQRVFGVARHLTRVADSACPT